MVFVREKQVRRDVEFLLRIQGGTALTEYLTKVAFKKWGSLPDEMKRRVRDELPKYDAAGTKYGVAPGMLLAAVTGSEDSFKERALACARSDNVIINDTLTVVMRYRRFSSFLFEEIIDILAQGEKWGPALRMAQEVKRQGLSDSGDSYEFELGRLEDNEATKVHMRFIDFFEKAGKPEHLHRYAFESYLMLCKHSQAADILETLPALPRLFALRYKAGEYVKAERILLEDITGVVPLADAVRLYVERNSPTARVFTPESNLAIAYLAAGIVFYDPQYFDLIRPLMEAKRHLNENYPHGIPEMSAVIPELDLGIRGSRLGPVIYSLLSGNTWEGIRALRALQKGGVYSRIYNEVCKDV